MAEPERGICVFDLDHTLLHMLKEEDMPAEVGDVTEDVVGFSYQGVDYSIALRVGTTSLVSELQKKGIDVAVATCNLLGDQARTGVPPTPRPPRARPPAPAPFPTRPAPKVVEAIADRCDVFKDIPVHVIESRDKGGKSLKDLGLSRPRVVIFDDSINAWVAEDQEFVFTADRFDVNAMASAIQADDDAGDEAVDRELGYLTNIREAVMGFFAPPTIDWNEGLDSEPGTPREPRPERSSSFSKEFHGSPAASASSARLSEAPGADGDALSDTNRPLKDRSLKRPAGDEPPPSPDLSKKPRTTTDADATTARLDLPSLVPPSELANAAVAVQQEQVSASWHVQCRRL
ncbi:hypothetical protein JL721_10050 [Aureococcus anophagefferens]|nr:hypothetical protein JL721_10050 [Aureococcus anophagefferens]